MELLRINTRQIVALLLVIVFLLGFTFFVYNSVFVNPDFGWHLRIGQIFLNEGVFQKDPFSYTMPSYFHIYHDWFSSVLIAIVNNSFGYIGAVWVFTILFALIFIFQGLYYRNFFSLLLIILEAGVIVNFPSLRVYLFSWIFIVCISAILFDSKNWERNRWFLPFIFIVWPNLHGEFSIGYFIMIAFLGLKAFSERVLFFNNLFCDSLGKKKFLVSHFKELYSPKPFDRVDFLVICFCFFVIFINPYGGLIWKNPAIHLTDFFLRYTIQEWMPSIFFVNLPMWVYFIFSAYLVVQFRAILPIYFLISFWAMWILGLSAIRHVPIMILFTFPIVLYCLRLFYFQLKMLNKSIFVEKYFVFMLLFFCSVFLYQFLFMWTGIIIGYKNDFYPTRAIEYLKSNLPDGEIFSYLSWGGYLIWKLPEKKVFVDGRMVTWSWHAPNSFESDNAFLEYQRALTGEASFSEIVAKYKISTVLMPVGDMGYKPDLFLMFRSALFAKNSFYSQLKHLGFKEVYRDKTAVVYMRLES